MSKKKNQTQDTKNKPIDEQIKEARQTLSEIAASLGIYMQVHQPPKVVGRVQELQDRLEFRTKQYELELLKEKVSIYKECLSLIKK